MNVSDFRANGPRAKTSDSSSFEVTQPSEIHDTECYDTTVFTRGVEDADSRKPDQAPSSDTASASNEWTLSVDSPEMLEVGERLIQAMKKLLRAHRFAIDCNRSRWDFAVEIAELRALSVSNEELRWLIGKGLIDHAEEIPGDENRRNFNAPSGFTLSKQTCFVLTDIGIQQAQVQIRSAKISARSPEQSQKPCWDLVRHELRLGETLVKKFKWRAANQEAILCAFEEEGWPPHIDDPLPPILDKDPKRRLSDAIKCLNRKQLNTLVRFSGDGTGEGVYWELI